MSNIIGDRRGSDARCAQHIDYSESGTPIYEGESFSCTYCGTEWVSFVGLSINERVSAELAARGQRCCPECESVQPMFQGDKCELCTNGQTLVVCPDHDCTHIKVVDVDGYVMGCIGYDGPEYQMCHSACCNGYIVPSTDANPDLSPHEWLCNRCGLTYAPANWSGAAS